MSRTSIEFNTASIQDSDSDSENNDLQNIITINNNNPLAFPSSIFTVIQPASNPQKSFETDQITTTQGQKHRYWKINFIIVFFPLTFCGFPIHLLLFGRRGITSWKQWLHQIFFKDHPLMIFITVLFLCIGLCLNAYCFIIARSILYTLLIKGEVQNTLFEDLVNLFRKIPLVIPINLTWIFGYTIRKLLLSFDRITYPELDVSFGLNKSKSSKWKSGWSNIPPYRLWIFGIYILILINQSIAYFLTIEKIKKNSNSNNIENWINFSMNCMYNLMLPIYMMIAWAIQFEFGRLSLYIKSLIGLKIQPSFGYFAEIKKYFKQVANHVLLANDICNIYISWVLIIIYLGMYNEAYGFVREVIGAIFWTFLDGSKLDLEPLEIRMFVGNLFSMLFQVIIMGFTIWSAIMANDMARLLHVRLNDFVSEPYVNLTPELYKSFRVLKYYMHSRMETEKPALLIISIVTAMPFCSTCCFSMMTRYRLVH